VIALRLDTLLRGSGVIPFVRNLDTDRIEETRFAETGDFGDFFVTNPLPQIFGDSVISICAGGEKQQKPEQVVESRRTPGA